MIQNLSKNDFIFLLSCFGLGLLAEASFFHGEIGVSYLIFITAFYTVFFVRFKFSHTHRRIGLLLSAVIWILSASFLFFDHPFFQPLNFLIIPFLTFTHIVLITSPEQLKWSERAFVKFAMDRFKNGFKYISSFFEYCLKHIFKNMKEETVQYVKQIAIGLLIGLPLLLFVTSLLMSADQIFENMMLQLPQFFLELNMTEAIFRTLAVIIMTFIFFGMLQSLKLKHEKNENELIYSDISLKVNGISAITILILLNCIYGLFTAVQFQYFFSGKLVEGMTYAEYARRGFFELLFVTLINWSVLLAFLVMVRDTSKKIRLVLKTLYSLLILFSGVMLISSYQRLSMYEAAYGFTIDRILAHAFMIFLIVIFAYTLVRVWIDRLPLIRFYVVAGLIFYSGLNVISTEDIIVKNNLERYENTGKIDLYYLQYLSYTGVNGLITLYEKQPDTPGLKGILLEEKNRMEGERDNWQSYNIKKQKVKERLKNLNLN